MSFFNLFMGCCPYLTPPDMNDSGFYQQNRKTVSKEDGLHRICTFEISDVPECCIEMAPLPKEQDKRQRLKASASPISKRPSKEEISFDQETN